MKYAKWIVRYECGCTEEAPRKRDLLEYCGTHGSEAAEWIPVPTKRQMQMINECFQEQGDTARTGPKFQVVGPDGISDRPEPYDTLEEADKAKAQYLERFRQQGYYLTARGKRIPVADLAKFVKIRRVVTNTRPGGTN
jgi:hypothetical protein